MNRGIGGRGMAIASAVLLVGLLNVVFLGSVRPGADDALLAESRAERVRALHAAEGLMRIVIEEFMRTGEPPEAGRTISVGSAMATVVSAPPDEGSGEVVLEGRSGSAKRRLSVIIQ